MDNRWSNAEQLQRFMDLYQRKSRITKRHTKEIWDERAQSWEAGLRCDEERKKRSDNRIAAAAAFLRSHGLLGADCEAIDIGCGPGRFVAEFAKTAKYVVGTDLSPKMIDYAAEFAREQGLKNTSFIACDFKQADIDQYGWRERFDLVFMSITPAVSNFAGLEKAMSMSRGWCFNGSFLSGHDELLELVSKQVFGREPVPRWNGRTSYALFNLLWLYGWHPYVTYYTEESKVQYVPDRALAVSLAENLGIDRDDQERIEKIYRFMMEKAEKDGPLEYSFGSEYIWLLWNINEKADRASYEPGIMVPEGNEA